jgi:hypothetical protein
VLGLGLIVFGILILAGGMAWYVVTDFNIFIVVGVALIALGAYVRRRPA